MNPLCATAAAGNRPRYRVLVQSPEYVLVDLRHASLGFNANDALEAKSQAAAVLARLANQPRDLSPLRPSAPQLDFGRLHLSACEASDVLWQIRDASAPLRNHLDAVAEPLHDLGLFEAGEQEEPALEFVEAVAPLPWELLYEGSLGDEPDWERFWGFRVPISHWQLSGQTSETIRIANGVFSVVCSTLRGSGPEIRTLVEEIDRQAPGLMHLALEEALRQRLEQQCGGSLACAEGWLRSALERLPPRPGATAWKRQALMELLKRARKDHPLVHFACHGDSSFSQLCFEVGGEGLALPMTLLDDPVLKQPPPARGQPRVGPLVFLNACSTNLPTAGSLSFPRAWINYGAAAVIATLCPVPDDFALAFSRHFYGLVLGGGRTANLAEALLATRRHFMKEFNNPLGLAYVLYARKETQVVLPAAGK